MRRLLEATPPEGQRMLFSATLDSAVDVLVRRFLTRPAVHEVDSLSAPDAIVHHLLTMAPADRGASSPRWRCGKNRSLIFTRTKHGAQKLARQLAAAHARPSTCTAAWPRAPASAISRCSAPARCG